MRSARVINLLRSFMLTNGAYKHARIVGTQHRGVLMIETVWNGFEASR